MGIRATNKSIFVTFSQEGIHKYPEAGINPELQDVSFLQFPHRHIFKFKVEISVTSDNREIEFIQFKRWLLQLYSTCSLELNNKSCEMMCNDLLETILKVYPGRSIKIEISEDGENGAIVEYVKEI